MVSMAVGGDDYVLRNGRCLGTHVDFCSSHGFGYRLVDDLGPYMFRGVRPYPWYKVPLVRELLDLHEFVLWVDCDAMFVVPGRDHLSPLLRGFSSTGASVLCAEDDSGNVNTGVVLFRSTPDVREMLDMVWAREEFIHHGWWENMAFIHLLGTDSWFSERCRVVPRGLCHILQGYPGHAGGLRSPVVHFAGAMKGMMDGYVVRQVDFDLLLRDIGDFFGS